MRDLRAQCPFGNTDKEENSDFPFQPKPKKRIWAETVTTLHIAIEALLVWLAMEFKTALFTETLFYIAHPARNDVTLGFTIFFGKNLHEKTIVHYHHAQFGQG